MRIVCQFRRYQATDTVDFSGRDLGRLTFECHESYSTVGLQRFVISPVVIHVYEKVILEQRLFDDFVPVAPTAANFVGWKECFDPPVGEVVKNLFFMSWTRVESIPTRHFLLASPCRARIRSAHTEDM